LINAHEGAGLEKGGYRPKPFAGPKH